MPLRRMKDVHESITSARLLEAVERQNTTLDDPGFCLACGEEQEGCEPDATRLECESCGEEHVYGADYLLQADMYWSDK